MSDNAIDVSFVMTVYNKEYYLPSVLKALLNQTGLKNPEYIFVDDLSSDRSVEIIREMTQGIPNVKIIANKENRGISVRINQGIAEAEGEYTRMLDSDDIFPLDSTEKMLELARKHKADMVGVQLHKPAAYHLGGLIVPGNAQRLAVGGTGIHQQIHDLVEGIFIIRVKPEQKVYL